ncbi:MAG: PqqD family protein, partial [Bacteroidetes bacterium]
MVTVSDDLTTADLGGEAIVLDVKSGNYFGLNEVGAFILECIR